MPSGSFSKRARNTDSVINKKNCGGNKKAGLAPRATGPTQFRNVAMIQGVNFKIHKGGLPCPTNYSNNPGGQCAGGVGALASTRNRGCNNLTICEKPNNLASLFTRISSNPTVEVLIRGELNAAKLDEIATKYGEDGFRNPTEIIIGRSVTAINGDLLNGAGSNPKRLQTFGFKEGSGHQCVSIGTDAFYQCSNLVSVDIPNSVTSIGDSAFDSCSSLESVVIPESVTSIGNQSFTGCTSLESVDIPNSVTSIGVQSFADCTSLTSVVIPKSVTLIGAGAFSGCTALTSVVIGNSVTSINQSTFFNCTALKSVVIGNSVTFIGIDAFNSCTSLVSADIPNSVTSIGERAFESCVSLTSVDIPNSVTDIAGATFTLCSSLVSVVIPNSVETIGAFAFGSCTALTSVVIPNSVTDIGFFAFSSCTALASVTFKANINTSITSNAFANAFNGAAAAGETGRGTNYNDPTPLGQLTSFTHTSDVIFGN